MKLRKIRSMILMVLLIITIAGCGTTVQDNGNSTRSQVSDAVTIGSVGANVDIMSEGSLLDTADLFSERDLEQIANITDAKYIELKSGSDEIISEEGIYVITGDVENSTIIVDVDDGAKVQLVLNGVNITNEDAPAIYVKSSDKVFVTTTDSSNYMEVSGNYVPDGDTNLDAVIFSKEDLVLNGIGTLEIISNKGNGIASKDALKITGGKYTITSVADSIEANDYIYIYDGDITINAGKDALHSENDDDESLGYIYIQNGILNITAADDGIRGTSIVQIDGGTIKINTCTEGIEGTYLQINGGNIQIYATDDGINATNKSDYDVVIEVNGGIIDITMGSGDTDAFDANGSIFINGGTITIEATSAFDADVIAQLNAGDVTVNGEVITEIVQSHMGGPQGGHPMDGGKRH